MSCEWFDLIQKYGGTPSRWRDETYYPSTHSIQTTNRRYDNGMGWWNGQCASIKMEWNRLNSKFLCFGHQFVVSALPPPHHPSIVLRWMPLSLCLHKRLKLHFSASIRLGTRVSVCMKKNDWTEKNDDTSFQRAMPVQYEECDNLHTVDRDYQSIEFDSFLLKMQVFRSLPTCVLFGL